MADTIKMIREEWEAKGGPLVTDVHVSEVENYRIGGWRIAESDASVEAAPVAEDSEEAGDETPRRGRPRKG